MTSALATTRPATSGAGPATLSVAEAVVRYLAVQHLDDGTGPAPIFAGVTGILGHGNLAGIGEALRRQPNHLRFVPARNEQAMVHMAAGFARASRRRKMWACTSSIGPGATNMVTAAAGATINRLPVLLLPGDNFATRRPDPVLQQLDLPTSGLAHVNETLRPVSRYFDVIQRPEQLWSALERAMEVLTSPADTGAVTLALPQDVQVEVGTFDPEMFEERIWHLERRPPDAGQIDALAAALRASERPLIVAGGGVLYSGAEQLLAELAERWGIPVVVTQAGMSCLSWEHPTYLGGVGATGTSAANAAAAQADLVIGIGTRWSDFTTASRTAFAAGVPRYSINVARPEAHRHGAGAVVADARLALDALATRLDDLEVDEGWTRTVAELRSEWAATSDALRQATGTGAPTQAQLIAVVEEAVAGRGTVVCAAGSMPGDLHKLWRPTAPGDYHVEYGYSCMGYEIPGALGIQLAEPDRQAVAMIGDGSWLMMHTEIVTAIQEGMPLAVVLVDNGGYASIGSLSRSVGSEGFATQLVRRADGGELSGEPIHVDYAASARALGADVVEADVASDVAAGLDAAWRTRRPTVIVVQTDTSTAVPSFDSWWDVPTMGAADPMLDRQDARP